MERFDVSSIKIKHLAFKLSKSGTPDRFLGAKNGDNCPSIRSHGMRRASTASGWRRSIIWSNRARKKSVVFIRNLYVESPRNCIKLHQFLGDSATTQSLEKPVFTGVPVILQGSLSSLQPITLQILIRWHYPGSISEACYAPAKEVNDIIYNISHIIFDVFLILKFS
jgi:hypothetical protein